jgi:hypothetical protein
MVEYEWEVGRLPRAPSTRSLAVSRLRRSEIAQYAALEFPREGVAWVVNTERDREQKPPNVVRSRATRPVRRESPPL